MRFARYLAARDKGLKEFAKFQYEPVEGDEWAETPNLVLYSGAMLRPGIENTLKEFEQREGCQFTTVYNGCGILTAQMRAGERPDAYFSCDTSFMNTVADLYLPPADIVDNNLMIIVAKGNPCEIHTVADLAKPGLRVGLPHHEKSAMGKIAWEMLTKMKLYDALGANLKVESPTGDFLVNQLRTGSLDAVIACPTGVIGPYDYRRSEMGTIILDCIHSKVQWLIHGAYDFVDVRDVARGLLLAGEKGRCGETYILSGERMTYARLAETVHSILGLHPKIHIPIPMDVARFAAFFAPFYYRLSHTRPLLTSYALHTLWSNSFISSLKAQQELGYQPRPLKDSLADTIHWFLENKRQVVDYQPI